MKTFFRVCSDNSIRWFTEEDVRYGAFTVINEKELNNRIADLKNSGKELPYYVCDFQDVCFDGDGNVVIVDEDADDGGGFPAA